MPITRSIGDIPAGIDQEAANSTISLEQGAGDALGNPTNPVGRPRTRLQSREDLRVRGIVEESLSGFRDEMMRMLSNGFRDLAVANQGHSRQDGRHGEQNRDFHDIEGNIDRNSERVLNIIRNWRIHFKGDSSEFTVDEFIYRVRNLTDTNLRGNYNLLCEHAHILFEGKALKWFWRYHRISGDIVWEDLCDALKRQYKDYNTDFDIKDDILRRKQRYNETFDEYYDVITALCDRLRTPLTDYDLCETIQRNLRPEVRHELLHLEITRVAQLRRAVRRHEKFVNDVSASNSNNRQSKKGNVSEVIDDDTQFDKEDESLVNDTEVCLVVRTGLCWNCDKAGHSFIDCLEPRTVFCYGCGTKNVYKPKCSICVQKRGNALKDVRAKRDGHPKQC